MKKYPLVLLVCLITVPLFAQLQVSNHPTGAAVVITQPSAVLVTWSIRDASGAPVEAVSEEGLFVLGDQVLGSVPASLTTVQGSVPETLLIPPSVSNRALKLNAPTFFYQRTFRSTTDGSTGQSALTCRISTSAYGNFSIAAVTLFFKNQRGEATFSQNQKGIQAFAEVHYNGSGLLKAIWEVQEPGTSLFRTLEPVNNHITYGDKIVFASPTIPPLPTVVTGRHTVRFRILEPISGFELPQVTYFVKAGDPEVETEQEFRSLAPLARARLSSSTPFQWVYIGKAILLKFCVYEQNSLDASFDSPSREPLADQQKTLFPVPGVEIFSVILPADSKAYSLKPGQVARLRSGQWYLWQLKALDSTGTVLAQSDFRQFQLTGKEAVEKK